MIKKWKMQYEIKLAGNIKNDTKSFYRNVKRKRLVKKNVGPLQTEMGECIIRDKEMTEQLNTHFGPAFTKEDANQMPEMLENAAFSEREELREINISREMVLGKLMGLKADKS